MTGDPVALTPERVARFVTTLEPDATPEPVARFVTTLEPDATPEPDEREASDGGVSDRTGSARIGGRIEFSLWAAGLFLVGLGIGHVLGVAIFQIRESARLERRLNHASAPSEPIVAQATRAELARTGLVGHLRIKRIGVAGVVVEGDDPLSLNRAIGHIPGTALPGESGNVCLAGHRDSFFRGLKDVRVKDVIEFVTPDGKFIYVVESTHIVPPEEVGLVAPTRRSSLTLVTCYPFSYIGKAPQRFVVRAVRFPRESMESESVDPESPLVARLARGDWFAAA